MNETDKKLYFALITLSKEKIKLSRLQANKIFPDYVVTTLKEQGYATIDEGIFGLTNKGLEELRKLESIHSTQITIIISIFAIIISLISLIISIFKL